MDQIAHRFQQAGGDFFGIDLKLAAGDRGLDFFHLAAVEYAAAGDLARQRLQLAGDVYIVGRWSGAGRTGLARTAAAACFGRADWQAGGFLIELSIFTTSSLSG